jgi:aspartate dehydrogenase
MKYVYPMSEYIEKVGIAGVGALGGIVAKALLEGMPGYVLDSISDLKGTDIGVPNVSFEELAERCDVIVECLPPREVPVLAKAVLAKGKTMIMISSCALVLHPELNQMVKEHKGRIIVPSGALSGLDGVLGMVEDGIQEAKIMSTKPPKGFAGAPYIVENNIDVTGIQNRFMIFSGNVLEAAKAFPANVNVAASLALAGIGAERTQVEVWADPQAKGNSHEIYVKGSGSVISAKIENVPDPSNPKSSMQAGHSIVAALRKRKSNLTIY